MSHKPNGDGIPRAWLNHVRRRVLKKLIQSVQLQEQGKVNWVSSLTDDPSILNVDVSRPPESNRPTLEVTDIPQAQMEGSFIGNQYSFVKADKRPTASQKSRESADTRLLLHEWQKLWIDAAGVLRRKSGARDQIILSQEVSLDRFERTSQQYGSSRM